MSILTANGLAVTFGAFDLFWNIHVNIANDARIGLIGPNGVGKTTLLLALAGLQPPSRGAVHLARGRRLGYLRQEAIEAFASGDNTVYAEMLAVFSELQEQQQRLHALEQRMEGGELSEALLEEYGRMQAAFEQAGGYDYDLRIQQTLTGLGLGKADWQTPLNQLSGGQKTRALLARLLLEKPDLLMLDEPTNHLDLEAIEWLEHTLSEWQGAVLIVSHDRYFLDNSVNTIWEMSNSGIESYSGNYSAYLLQRQERWEYYERVFSEEKARLLNEVDYIQRNWVRASTHAQALGRLRRLSRDLAVVAHYGILALREVGAWHEYGLSVERPLDVVEAVRQVNSIQMQHGRPPVIRPRLDASATPGGNLVLRARRLTIGYPGRPLFEVDELELRRGECVALIGPNGSGKTTFLKALLQQVPPLKGELLPGAGLKIGYFAQSQERLQGEHSVLDELQRHRPMLPGEARSYLAPYLFRGEDVFKPLSALSGGERARLALAILALDGYNFLLMDEPTNHLDIPAREALQAVLDGYKGTILLVSHDRYLVDRLATQIWELRDGKLHSFKGPYREYLLRGLGRKPQNGRGQRAAQTLLHKPLLKVDGHNDKRRLQALERIEERIRRQEADVQRLSHEMQQAADSKAFERLRQVSQQIAQAQNHLEQLMGEWERLAA